MKISHMLDNAACASQNRSLLDDDETGRVTRKAIIGSFIQYLDKFVDYSGNGEHWPVTEIIAELEKYNGRN